MKTKIEQGKGKRWNGEVRTHLYVCVCMYMYVRVCFVIDACVYVDGWAGSRLGLSEKHMTVGGRAYSIERGEQQD